MLVGDQELEANFLPFQMSDFDLLSFMPLILIQKIYTLRGLPKVLKSAAKKTGLLFH